MKNKLFWLLPMFCVLSFTACAKDASGDPDDGGGLPDWSNWTGDVFTINQPAQVEDCILRRSDMEYRDEKFWTAWNFGASQTLDIGYAIAMWNMWHGNVLVRFDLRGVPCGEVAGATFRIYAPKNITQVTGEVPVSVHQVKSANSNWREGGMESLPQTDAASWLFRTNGQEWAGGQNGCGVADVDYVSRSFGTRNASKYDSQWLEYDIPKALVEQWLSYPEENAGLLVRVAQDQVRMGDHVLFYSSEHGSGKGPELIIYGHTGSVRVAADPAKNYNPRYVMPPQGSKFQQYLNEDNSRYKKWTLDPVLGLTGDQRIYPYYWDMVVDGDYILPYSYYPFSQSILQVDDLIAQNDPEALRRWQVNRLKYLHLWEYCREQRWYDCGDIIEYLTPRQAALLWLGSTADNGMSNAGILNDVHPKGKQNLTQEQIDTRVSREWSEINGKVTMTSAQKAVVEPFIKEIERLRCQHYNTCNTAAQQVHTFLTDPQVGDRYLIDALSTFMNYHDIYLYYDSFFQIKRCAFLLENTDLASFTAFWREQKYDEYSPSRITGRFNTAVKYWPEDRPAIRVESKNNFW